MSRNSVIEKEAENLVGLGIFEDVDDAWEEAEAICEDSDAFCVDDDEDDEARFW